MQSLQPPPEQPKEVPAALLTNSPTHKVTFIKNINIMDHHAKEAKAEAPEESPEVKAAHERKRRQVCVCVCVCECVAYPSMYLPQVHQLT